MAAWATQQIVFVSEPGYYYTKHFKHPNPHGPLCSKYVPQSHSDIKSLN